MTTRPKQGQARRAEPRRWAAEQKEPALVSEVLRSLDRGWFEDQRPFPWANPSGLLSATAFDELCETFPALELFEHHQDLPRARGQRPHNRWYLAYEETIYRELERPAGQGVVRHHQLPEPWRRFLDELRSDSYRGHVANLLGVENPIVRFAWHVGSTGSEVSPHRDSHRKAGTHIFYFNTRSDWDPAWGGATRVLGGKTVEHDHPDFEDFQTCDAAEILDNKSFLFRRAPNSWHGVEALTCPMGRQRRLFNVIFEHGPPVEEE